MQLGAKKRRRFSVEYTYLSFPPFPARFYLWFMFLTNTLNNDLTAMHYALMRTPDYITTYNNEAPCGEENCVQWIPPSRVQAFNRARGPPTEPPPQQVCTHCILTYFRSVSPV